MELDARKMQILEAVIDEYVLTAAPVGSRTLAKRSDIGLSPATIRNEMSDLEELGFLEQPHTSAGRIPSDRAYRYYVDTIMRKARLSQDEIKYIRGCFSRRMTELESVVRQTAMVLSSVTKYTSMVLAPQVSSVKLRHIQIVPMGDGRALLLVVTDAGLARDVMIRVPRDITADRLDSISSMLTTALRNRGLTASSKLLLPALSAELESNKRFILDTLDALDTALLGDSRQVELSGATNILNYPEYSDMEKAKTLLSTIEGKDLLYSMMAEATKVEFSITIGGENRDPSMKDASVVTATYKAGDDAIGSLGVIGPTRMDYPRVLALLGYIGRSLSAVLTNAFDEDDD